jgi:FtsZ-interacting cell division protein ZipA
MKDFLLILISIGAILLVAFLVKRNAKDGRQFTKQLNEDYRKSKDEEGDTPSEEALK